MTKSKNVSVQRLGVINSGMSLPGPYLVGRIQESSNGRIFADRQHYHGGLIKNKGKYPSIHVTEQRHLKYFWVSNWILDIREYPISPNSGCSNSCGILQCIQSAKSETLCMHRIYSLNIRIYDVLHILYSIRQKFSDIGDSRQIYVPRDI